MEVYENAGKPWTKEEDENLIDLYVNKETSVLDISQIHKRFPGGIIARIRHLGIVQNDFDIRDIEKVREFVQSESFLNLKKQILEAKRSNRTERQERLPRQANDEIAYLKRDIVALRNELSELKSIVKEVIYEIYKRK